MIKRCNDFGAGGVSVAIGELADGLYIDLDKVTKKYDGLDGTELAISESQERMAVALAPEDVDKFIAIATEENLEATAVAKVTEEKRLRMVWNGVSIVNIRREFLNSNGAEKHLDVHVERPDRWQPAVGRQHLCQKMAPGGRPQRRRNKGLLSASTPPSAPPPSSCPLAAATSSPPSMAMVAKLPSTARPPLLRHGLGLQPLPDGANQFAALPGRRRVRLQTRRRRLPPTGRLPLVPGVLRAPAQRPRALGQAHGRRPGCAGGPDRPGRRRHRRQGLHERQLRGRGRRARPPTLISFAVAVGKAARATSPEFKAAGHRIVCIEAAEYGDDYRPSVEGLLESFNLVEGLVPTARRSPSPRPAMAARPRPSSR